MVDREKLRQMWATRLDLPLREIADYFDATPGQISGIIRRAQRAEGFERWPRRSVPIPAKPKPPPPPRVAPGASTLPPLASLEE